MKIIRKSLFIITTFTLLFFPKVNFGQAPDLGTASGFALFTSAGAFTVTDNATHVTGDVGTHVGVFTAFPPGTLVGQIHVADATSAQAATDVAAAYSDLFGRTCSTTLTTPLGNGQTLAPGVYCLTTASTLNGDLILDGGGDPNALFIIKIGGAFATGASSNVILIDSADLCNVYWQIGGQFDLGDGSVFRGTAIVDGAINLLGTSSLLGRGLSRAGAISLNNNIVNFLPAAAGNITGTAVVCQGLTGVSYSVAAITNATSYIWVLPAGATIIAGANTNSITVSFGMSAISGNITVQGSNGCGTGTVSENYYVTVNPLPFTSLIWHF
ncbi:MAG: hypothetical protein A2W85_11350 [Bacteroidetes bacterium GWF2_41_31]|nr:MAG: hypothetical protein A2W85_11350 [Bacteroidetes bacterium GWF2_41_31]